MKNIRPYILLFMLAFFAQASYAQCNPISGFTKLGEHDGHAFYLSDASMPWSEAKTLAENAGGYLATLNSQAENDFLKSHLDGNMVFIGFNDATSEGTGQWANGEPVTLDLSYGNTDNHDYAVMNFWAGTWQMEKAGPWRKFIMEKNCGGGQPVMVTDIMCPTDYPGQENSMLITATFKNNGSGMSEAESFDFVREQHGFQVFNAKMGTFDVPPLGAGETIAVSIMVDNLKMPGGYFSPGVTGVTIEGYFIGKYIDTPGAPEYVNLKDFDYYCLKDNADFSISAEIDDPIINDNNSVSLKLQITNNGPEKAHNIKVINTKDAPAWAFSPGGSYVIGTDGSFTIPSLEVGETKTVALIFTAVSGDIINFVATVSSGHIVGEDTTDNSVSFTFTKNSNGGCEEKLGFTKLGEYNGHGYFMSNDNQSWNQAKTFAANAGGYLATMNDQAENDFLKSHLDGNMVFIGFNDATSEGTGQWTNGEPVTLDLSYGNTDSHDYAVMNFWAGTWQMEKAGPWRKFIMEMDCGATTTCPTDLTILSQEVVDDFASYYPGCTTIEGTLTIGGWAPPSGVQNLTGLAQLQSVQGDLIFLNNILLTSFSGLSNIESVGGNLHIYGNHALSDCLGLESLTSIGGDLRIGDNVGMTSTSGLQNLLGINGGLVLFANNSLSDISALSNVNANTIKKLIIRDNISLNECAITPICEVLATEAISILIKENGISGCSSPDEVNCNPSVSCSPKADFTSLGEYNGHGYYLSDASATWAQAKTFAEDAGGYLATMNDQAENDFLKSHLDGNMAFIGYNDATTEGVGQWANNEPVTLDLSYGNKAENDYAVMNFWSGTWQMVKQAVHKPFVMEMNCASPQSAPLASNLTVSSSIQGVYPNPANDKITLQIVSKEEKEAFINIYDSRGQLLLSEKRFLPQGTSEVEFDLSKMPKGMYFVKEAGSRQYSNFVILR